MIERKIQTETYWREDFSITDQDMEDLAFLFLEAGQPMSVAELARELIAGHCRREEGLIRRRLSLGILYRPNGTFSVGERVVFPHLDFALGTVVDQRAGHNPEYGDFKVIAVQFENEDQGKVRSFAAELGVAHKLAFPPELSWEELFALSPDDLYSRYGDVVASELRERLLADPGFVAFRGQWLPITMLADLHVGYLNIAEAMVDIKGEPLLPEELLAELDLPAEIPKPIRIFSLNLSMSQDGRFDDVGDDQRVVWSLRRWEPEAVLLLPERLRYEPIVYDRTGLDVTHLQLEREIDDEASNLIAPPTAASANSLTLILGYAHWRVGTLPLTDRTRVFFPSGSSEQHTLITFVDRANREQFPGWIVHAHRFVYGLGEWYKSNNIPVGAYIKLERTEDPLRVAVDFIPRRMQREWVRVAIRNADGELGFQLQKRPIACEYDELCLMDEVDQATIDDLWQKEQDREHLADVLSPREKASLYDELVTHTFLELAKLSPNGMVHSKTLYTAINIVNRCPPGPVFATLFRIPEFVTAGDGFWVFQGGADGPGG